MKIDFSSCLFIHAVYRNEQTFIAVQLELWMVYSTFNWIFFLIKFHSFLQTCSHIVRYHLFQLSILLEGFLLSASTLSCFTKLAGGGEIAQWLASLSVQVRSRHDLLVSERWKFYQGAIELFPSMCYHVYVIMHVKDP